MSPSPNNNLNLADLKISQHNVQSIKSNKLQIINFLEKYNAAGDIFSTPIPKVDTNLRTKLNVCGVIVASLTELRFSKAMA